MSGFEKELMSFAHSNTNNREVTTREATTHVNFRFGAKLVHAHARIFIQGLLAQVVDGSAICSLGEIDCHLALGSGLSLEDGLYSRFSRLRNNAKRRQASERHRKGEIESSALEAKL